MTKDKKSEADKFMQGLKEDRIKFTKLLNPRVCYTSNYDIFDIVWGNKKIDSTIELNLLHEGDLRFDIAGDIIVGIEIENFSEVLKKFDCDKDEKFKKKIDKEYEKTKNKLKNTKNVK
jgi:hypothetical protein